MAGLRGKQAWLAAGKQASAGTVAPAAKHMWAFAGGNVQPRRETERLQETDDSRDQGVAYVRSSGVEGQPEVYVRDNSIDFLLAAALGGVADSGAMPNFIHTVSPADALPLLTVWRMIGGVLFEQFLDTKVSELVIRSDAGSPLTAQATLMGLTPTRLTSDPSTAWVGPPVVSLESGTVYTQNDMTVTLAGSLTHAISSFELSISNNVAAQQTDNVVPYDLNDGTREVSLSFDMIFENLNEYNRFHYGATGGTAASNVIAEVAANFSFSKGINNSVVFDLPKIAYEEFPVEPQPDGSPLVVSVRANVQRQPAGAAIMTSTIKNQKATTF